MKIISLTTFANFLPWNERKRYSIPEKIPSAFGRC